jgi:hypothetical protein
LTCTRTSTNESWVSIEAKRLTTASMIQYRLFSRYHAPSKVIVFAWINDEDTKRADDSREDT